MFQRRRFFAGSADHGGESPLGDIHWFNPAAEHMTDDGLAEGDARTMMVFLNGEAIPEPDPRGQPIVDDDFILLFNADADALEFTLPPSDYGRRWRVEVDTVPDLLDPDWHEAGTTLVVEARSLVVMRCPRDDDGPTTPSTGSAGAGRATGTRLRTPRQRPPGSAGAAAPTRTRMRTTTPAPPRS